jgi:quercetin dioxygenase-like cupin family protein
MTSRFDTRVLLRSEQSNGAISVVENTVPARWDGPPLHRHDFDEGFYVLDGELTLQLGADLFTAGPGAVAFAPGGVDHTLANLGDAPARYVLLCTPAGFERYFARLAAEGAGEDPPSWALEPTLPVTTVGGQIGARDDLSSARPIAPAGGGINVVVHGEENDGRIGLMDNRMPAGAQGPPLHHHDFDELFWVLEGELTFQLGEELATRAAGELAFAPRGVHHTFANRGDAPAHFLLACTPAGFERHFARMAAERAGEDPPAWAMQPIPSVTKVGPPIGG